MTVFLSASTRPVKAATTIASNPDDVYFGGSWLGLRPPGPSETINYNQTVTNSVVSPDNVAEAILSAKVYSLKTGNPDMVPISFTLDTNTRHAISYSRAGPESLPFSYGVPQGATDTGIHCNGGCGAWINVPAMVFYGAHGSTGTYNTVWVSSDGFISVLGPPSPAGSMGPGIIAAFSRTLCSTSSCGGTIWYWKDITTGRFVVAWDNVISNGKHESFLIRVDELTASPCGCESQIEFWYSSVTQNDGITTAIGIADQYGTRVVSYDLATASSLKNQRLVFSSTSGTFGPKYLNQLHFYVSKTSNSVADTQADVSFDQSTNPPGNLVGYNTLLLSTIPSLPELPDYARTALAGAEEIYSRAKTPGKAVGGLIFNAIDLLPDTYNSLVEAYWEPKLIRQNPQSGQLGTNDPNPLSLDVYAAESGAAIPAFAPADASLGAKVIWNLRDPLRNLPHHLEITATVGYTDGCCTCCQQPDQYSVSVSLQLDINPDYKTFYDGFESGNFNPYNWAPTGTWNIHPCSTPLSGFPDCVQGSYYAWSAASQSGELAPLTLSLGNFFNYNQIVIYFHFYASMNPNEQVSISYLNQGVWNQWATYSGPISTSGGRGNTPFTRWINARMVVPSTSTEIGFTYNAPPSSSPGLGFFMDDIYVFGDGPGNSADVAVDGQLATTPTSQHPVPISIDGGPFYYTPDHALESTKTTHTLTAQSLFTDNSGSYSFQNWLDGVTSQSRTITVEGQLGFRAVYSIVPDFTVTADPSSLSIVPGASQTSTIYVTSRHGFAGLVSIVANAPSGLTASPSSMNVNSQGSYALTITVDTSALFGTYNVTVTGTGAGFSSSAIITVNVVCVCPNGSVASGTMITLANATQVPVQTLKTGMQLLSYDTTTNRFVTTTITRFVTVVTNNTMTITTSVGQNLIVDQNPAQELYVLLPNGTQTVLSVTLLKVGYSLFNIPTLSWVPITSIKYQNGGKHLMYDIYNTSPGSYIANGYLDPQKL